MPAQQCDGDAPPAAYHARYQHSPPREPRVQRGSDSHYVAAAPPDASVMEQIVTVTCR